MHVHSPDLLVPAKLRAASVVTIYLWHVCVFAAELTSSDLGILSAGFCFRWNVETTSELCTQ